jgi:hypothetical protein
MKIILSTTLLALLTSSSYAAVTDERPLEIRQTFCKLDVTTKRSCTIQLEAKAGTVIQTGFVLRKKMDQYSDSENRVTANFESSKLFAITPLKSIYRQDGEKDITLNIKGQLPPGEEMYGRIAIFVLPTGEQTADGKVVPPFPITLPVYVTTASNQAPKISSFKLSKEGSQFVIKNDGNGTLNVKGIATSKQDKSASLCQFFVMPNSEATLNFSNDLGCKEAAQKLKNTNVAYLIDKKTDELVEVQVTK